MNADMMMRNARWDDEIIDMFCDVIRHQRHMIAAALCARDDAELGRLCREKLEDLAEALTPEPIEEDARGPNEPLDDMTLERIVDNRERARSVEDF